MTGGALVGIGGWDFDGWRGSFYPAGLPRAQELEYAAARLTSIEINGTFYRNQTPQSFAKWRDMVPDGFVFSLKANRAASYGRDPVKLEAAIGRFVASGFTELGSRLGPILWQFPATRRFDAAEIARFLALLPPVVAGLRLQHVIEARHPSFDDDAYLDLLEQYQVADCIIDSAASVTHRRLTSSFAYLRLQHTLPDAPDGYDSAGLDRWTDWIQQKMTSLSCGVHVYFISGAKHRAPDAARALLHRLGYRGHGVPDRDLRQT